MQSAKSGQLSPTASEAVCDDVTSNPDLSLNELHKSFLAFSVDETKQKLPPGMPSRYPYPTQLRFTPSISLNAREVPASSEAPEGLLAPRIIKVKYFYPLKKELIIEYEHLEELSYDAFASLIQKEYQRLYSEEAESLKVQPKQRVANPYKSTYGIWGPGLEEMYLLGVTVDSFDDIGIPIYSPQIEDVI